MTANASREPSTAVSDIAPDSGRKLTSTEKWRFGVGFVLFSLIWMVAGTSGSAVLLPQRFTELNIGVPEVIGTMNSVGCVFALFSNVIFGALSDITRSRFGKRTPWIVAGGLITGSRLCARLLQCAVGGYCGRMVHCAGRRQHDDRSGSAVRPHSGKRAWYVLRILWWCADRRIIRRNVPRIEIH